MFALSATQTEWWFPVQNLKINMARPANGPMAGIGPYKWFLCLLRGADGRQFFGPLGMPPPAEMILSSISNSSLLIPDS